MDGQINYDHLYDMWESIIYDPITRAWRTTINQGENMNKFDEITKQMNELPSVKYKDISEEDLDRVRYTVVPREIRRAFSSKTDTVYNVFYIIDGKYLDEFCFGDKEDVDKNVMYLVRHRWEEHNKKALTNA